MSELIHFSQVTHLIAFTTLLTLAMLLFITELEQLSSGGFTLHIHKLHVSVAKFSPETLNDSLKIFPFELSLSIGQYNESDLIVSDQTSTPMSRVLSPELQKALESQARELERGLERLGNLDALRALNSDPLPNFSYFGTSSDSDISSMCRGTDAKRCGKKFLRLETRLRVSPKHKLIACIIQKNMSTMLQALMCYLYNTTAFKEEGREFHSECSNVRLCQGKNEHGSISNLRDAMDELLGIESTRGKMKDWSFLAITRHPIDRFLSGFLDKCIRKPYSTKHCNQCQANMTCFIMTEYDRLLKAQRSGRTSKTRSFEDRHFFPQSWRCSFSTHLKNYTLIKYPAHSSEAPAFLNKLEKFLRHKKRNVSREDVNFIRQQIEAGQTVHTTRESEARQFFEQRLRGSPFLMEFIMRMFYWDFKLFGYDLEFH
ncbi:sulfotransferase family domain-containing protein [Ditylenchus destructor]|nr:sulfotransferase family domain-containing protein [Ditylenchus destructor]